MWPAAIGLQAAKHRGQATATLHRGGLVVTCGTGRGQGSFCAVAGVLYEKELPWLLNALRPGDTFVDVGANIGIYSLHAARRLANRGAIFAIEPSPDACAVLRQNIASNRFNGVITAVHAAASRTKGQLYLAGDPGKWNSLQLQSEPTGVPIEVTAVDQVLSNPTTRRAFHFLKIDAEGVETDVLEGAWGSIQTSWPAIIFENSINRLRETPTHWLKARGYAIFAVSARGKLVHAPPDDYGAHINLVALHPRSRVASP